MGEVVLVFILCGGRVYIARDVMSKNAKELEKFSMGLARPYEMRYRGR